MQTVILRDNPSMLMNEKTLFLFMPLPAKMMFDLSMYNCFNSIVKLFLRTIPGRKNLSVFQYSIRFAFRIPYLLESRLKRCTRSPSISSKRCVGHIHLRNLNIILFPICL